MAPTAKPPAVYQLSANPMTTNNTTPTMEIVVYWRLRSAFAPAWMAAAMSCMRALPAGSLRMANIENTPYKTAMTPAPIASHSHVVATMKNSSRNRYLVIGVERPGAAGLSKGAHYNNVSAPGQPQPGHDNV